MIKENRKRRKCFRISRAKKELFEDFCQKAWEHYLHAEGKHPDFAQKFCNPRDLREAVEILGSVRSELADQTKKKKIEAVTVLVCEILEMLEAYLKGDLRSAIEEHFDHIAVSVRMYGMLLAEQRALSARRSLW